MLNQDEMLFCQSCAMPLREDKDFGENSDGGKCNDYCCHCWKNGKYTYESTFEQAVEANIPFWIKDFDGDADAARAKIIEVFKGLKRWES